MGQMRFRLHDRNRLAQGDLERIYVAGREEVPWSTRAFWEADQLVVERSTSDSGCVYVPWKIAGHGTHVLGTTSLMERARPYQLEVELARGLIYRIRNRLFAWEWLGLQTPGELQEQLQAATREFALAATSQQDPPEAAVAATRALAMGLATAQALVAKYTEQALAGRQRQLPIAALLGAKITPRTPTQKIRRQLVEACNIIELPIAWRALEAREKKRDWKQTDQQLAWCQQAGMKVAAGPLLQLDDLGIPDWLVLWEGDFKNLQRLMIEHVTAVVSRYAGRVHLWHVASRVNTGRLLLLSEEQRLQLVAQALEAVKKIDPRTPTAVSFDQPWAEYLAHHDADLAPLHYADALVRADLGVSGFGLEINAGFHPGGTSHRPTFELGRLLDQWSVWGLPLMLHLSTTSQLSDADLPKVPPPSVGGNSVDPQRKWAEEVLPLLLARSSVQVIFWNQLTDQGTPEFPAAGLFDAHGVAKPTLKLMRDLQKTCLL